MLTIFSFTPDSNHSLPHFDRSETMVIAQFYVASSTQMRFDWSFLSRTHFIPINIHFVSFIYACARPSSLLFITFMTLYDYV